MPIPKTGMKRAVVDLNRLWDMVEIMEEIRALPNDEANIIIDSGSSCWQGPQHHLLRDSPSPCYVDTSAAFSMQLR
jgi:hypothetical protein